RDARPSDDNVLGSFAGVLAGVFAGANQASAQLPVASQKPDGTSELEALPNEEARSEPERPAADKDSKNANDATAPDSMPTIRALMSTAIAPVDAFTAATAPRLQGE